MKTIHEKYDDGGIDAGYYVLWTRARIAALEAMLREFTSHSKKITWAFDVAETECQVGENDVAWMGRTLRAARALLAGKEAGNE